ncbi:MAG TPA: 2-isopropylmalate synthase [Actinomycetota bacterium]|nr:2-isopropylmalate synthase [Actinomycetota bacterium]
MSDRVRIFDTTLRDGEQSPGINLSAKEKVEIAHQLAALGVDVIEAGFPINSQSEFDAVQAVAHNVKGPVICGLARMQFADIDRAWESIKDAQKARIHVFIATSAIHMDKKLHKTPEQVMAAAIAGVERARGYTPDVEFSAEDATRSDPEFLVKIFSAAIRAGATTCNVPDTVGYALPNEYADLFRYLIENVEGSGDVIWSTHTHQDLGLAVANALAGVQAGARQVEGAMNAIGERAGNCSVEEVIMAIATRGASMGLTTGADTKQIVRTSRLVSALTGYQVPPNKAIVGANAFAHEAGIHQHGVLMDRTTYEIMDATSVGWESNRIVLGKHSGRHAFAKTLADMGYELSGEDLNRAWSRFRDLVDRKIEMTEADLLAIVTDEITSAQDTYVLDYLQVRGGTHARPSAKVRIRAGDEVFEESAEGDGMIDATCGAIQRALGINARLTNFKVGAATSGTDALGEVSVHVNVDGVIYSGKGVSTDVVEGSARAFLNAVNRATNVNTRRAALEAPSF